ncbi:hypothetical protein [uncultured Phenylobacterium sp.]|uniref:hypothetical protein n=1 Tax=uncultured Phenylobacterium sp. TaxID=349273 RepID=UPI0025DB89A2|nr:hypothetical protein [uncultured Phenylobacterium sp.]
MTVLLAWAARAALVAVFAVALYGALDPHHNAAGNAPPPDVVEHVVYGYLLTLLTIVSFPRVNPWLIGAGFLALGAGFELTQLFGLVSGTFQAKDFAANVGGVAAALAPMAVTRLRRGNR